MRYQLDVKSFQRWARLVHEQGRLKKKTPKGYRFKSKGQRLDGRDLHKSQPSILTLGYTRYNGYDIEEILQ